MTILTMEKIWDVIVIGGGPAGLTAAIYVARSGCSTLVLDKGRKNGALGLAHLIENFPGVSEGTAGEDLLLLLEEQATRFGAEIVREKVLATDFCGPDKKIYTAEKSYAGKAVILATGSMGHTPDIKGEAAFIGKGVAYCAACDAPLFRGRDVAVIGETAEAWEDLPMIAAHAAGVYFITHRRDFTDAAPAGKVTLLYRHRVKEIAGSGRVEKITVVEPSGTEREIDVAGVFIYLHGAKPVIDFLCASVKKDPAGCLSVDRGNMATSVEGVFAAGDVICHMVRQAVVSAAEGCIAALSAEKYLHKKDRIRPQWS